MSDMNKLKELSVLEIFQKDRYSIPIYQRNYAWREPQIRQLIQDVVDCQKRTKKDSLDKNYYIGTLVVWERRLPDATLIYDVIDGQQRLTTLSLLLCAIRQGLRGQDDTVAWFKEANLAFESRPASTEALQALFAGVEDGLVTANGVESDLLTGYKIAKKALLAILKEQDVNLVDFVKYLLNRVVILRVAVPKDTDLNHYFEIMNSRGEQLERHEILKAKLMNVLAGSTDHGADRARVFGMVWDACSDMDRYVQMGFEPKVARGALFGIEGDMSWDRLTSTSFDEVVKALRDTNVTNDALVAERQTLEEIVQMPVSPGVVENEPGMNDGESRFSSVINFQNFLLQVLRVYTCEDVPMDDKRLIEEFDDRLNNLLDADKEGFVAGFGYALLKCRYLFDRYVIKREYDSRWRVQRLKRQDKDPSKVYYVSTFGKDVDADGDEICQREIEMLLAMFHVSHPTMIYKHWLNAVLHYLYESAQIQAADYKRFLGNLADSFLRNRFLAKDPVDYYDLIYRGVVGQGMMDTSLLDRGTAVENFVFNLLDYKLWKAAKGTYTSFEFTFRSSVEHYYPQNPMDGVPALPTDVLNAFGNLCLISANRNSRLSNFSPSAKKDFYRAEKKVESIKQRIMMDDSNDPWDEAAILNHGKKMLQVLLTPCNGCEDGI